MFTRPFWPQYRNWTNRCATKPRRRLAWPQCKQDIRDGCVHVFMICRLGTCQGRLLFPCRPLNLFDHVLLQQESSAAAGRSRWIWSMPGKCNIGHIVHANLNPLWCTDQLALTAHKCAVVISLSMHLKLCQILDLVTYFSEPWIPLPPLIKLGSPALSHSMHILGGLLSLHCFPFQYDRLVKTWYQRQVFSLNTFVIGSFC